MVLLNSYFHDVVVVVNESWYEYYRDSMSSFMIGVLLLSVVEFWWLLSENELNDDFGVN